MAGRNQLGPGSLSVIPLSGRSLLEGVRSAPFEPGVPGQAGDPTSVTIPGGEILQKLQHPTFNTFEYLFRTLPEEGWFSPGVSPRNLVQFQLGSFRVPQQQQLWVFDYEFRVFRQSGLDAGDTVPCEEGRFSNIMGFDITTGQRRASSLLYQLDPVPVQLLNPEFQPPPGARASAGQFVTSGFQSFAATASPGLSLLPVWSKVQGAREAPFTIIAGENVSVGLQCVIFRPIPTPITFVEARIAGYLLESNFAQALLGRVRPR